MTATVTIHLRYFALLREQRGTGGETLTVAAATPRDLYENLSARYGFTLPPERMQVAINDSFSGMDAPLRDHDRVVFIPPVAGG